MISFGVGIGLIYSPCVITYSPGVLTRVKLFFVWAFKVCLFMNSVSSLYSPLWWVLRLNLPWYFQCTVYKKEFISAQPGVNTLHLSLIMDVKRATWCSCCYNCYMFVFLRNLTTALLEELHKPIKHLVEAQAKVRKPVSCSWIRKSSWGHYGWVDGLMMQ